jgi:hypothetical protein
MSTSATMPGLFELLRAAVDYAGLFPPAKLPMDQSIRNYVHYRRQNEAWMLGRFVCPAARLAELSLLVDDLVTNQQPLVVAALGRGGATAAEFLDNLQLDLTDIGAFRRRHNDRVVVDVFEARLPEEVVQARSAPAVARLLAAAADLSELSGPPTLMPYYEAAADDSWRDQWLAVFEGLYEDGASESAEARERCSPAGFKLRTGGVEAAAFPSAEQVAFVLDGCRHFDLGLKFTAGLHHPVRAYHESVATKMHGFMNVLLAALFAYAANWPREQLLRLLEDEDVSRFHVHEDGVGWEEHALEPQAIRRLRQEYGLTFGSCSFDEPRDDLRALGWLAR